MRGLPSCTRPIPTRYCVRKASARLSNTAGTAIISNICSLCRDMALVPQSPDAAADGDNCILSCLDHMVVPLDHDNSLSGSNSQPAVSFQLSVFSFVVIIQPLCLSFEKRIYPGLPRYYASRNEFCFSFCIRTNLYFIPRRPAYGGTTWESPEYHWLLQ